MPTVTDSSSNTPSDPEPQAQSGDLASACSDPKSPPLYFDREDIEDAPFWKEVSAFNQPPQPLIDEYYGNYVAVYGGNIVDSDPDETELASRFYRTFGYVPVYIHKVGVEDGLVEPREEDEL